MLLIMLYPGMDLGITWCDVFARFSEKHESMPFLCVVSPQNIYFVVPTLVLQLPWTFNRN